LRICDTRRGSHWHTENELKICRFKQKSGEVSVGLVADDSTLLDLTPAGITRLQP